MLEVFRVAFWQIDKKFAHNLKLLAHIRRISETLLLHLGQLFFLNFFKQILVWVVWGHWYPCFGLLVTSPLGFIARVGSLTRAWQRYVCYTFPEIHLWCDTCWPLSSQHGSWAISSTYLWGIGGTRNQELSCHRSQCEIRQTLYRLSYPGSAAFQSTLYFDLDCKGPFPF